MKVGVEELRGKFARTYMIFCVPDMQVVVISGHSLFDEQISRSWLGSEVQRYCECEAATTEKGLNSLSIPADASLY